MNVTAKGTIDNDSLKDVIKVSSYGKYNPIGKFLFYIVSFTVLIAAFSINGIYRGFNGYIWFILIANILGIIAQCFLFFFYPKTVVNSNKKFMGMVNQYVFTENSVSISSTIDNFNGECTIGYSYLKRTYETNRYYLIFQQQGYYIIDKTTIENNDDNILEATLKTKTKYIKCNY